MANTIRVRINKVEVMLELRLCSPTKLDFPFKISKTPVPVVPTRPRGPDPASLHPTLRRWSHD